MAIWNPFGKKKPTPTEPSPLPAAETTTPGAAVPSAQLTASGPPATERPAEERPAEERPAEERPAKERPAEAAAHPASEGESQPAPKRSMFGFLKQALKKTVAVLNTDIRDLVGKEGRLVDDEFLDDLFRLLVKTDMGVGPAGKIRDSIRSQYRGRKVMMSDLIKSAQDIISEIMEQDGTGINFASSGPTVIMVVGVNGSGKTTSIAKLTYRLTSAGKSVLLGAGDTFRAAAVEQLSIWSQRLGATIITGKPGSDPASVAYKAVEAGLKEQKDVVIVDTAGRLQTQTNLMDELSRIRRVIAKLIPEAPHEVLLVLDSTAGQNAISQAKGFSQAAGCTGIVLAKLDGTAKGGVAIPIRQEFGLPVKFIGLGETPDAFADFNVEQYVAALFDVDDES
jgi:fused signal recognition particle receptor